MDTQFKTNLINKLNERGLTQSSINLYTRNLELLNDDLPIKNLNFLTKVDDIEKKLIKYKDNTIRGYLISIVTCLKLFKNDKKVYEKAYNFFNNKMLNLAKKIKENTTDELTTEQRENWIKQDEVGTIFDNLKNNVLKFINNKVINENQYNQLLNLMVLSLYYLEEPRRNQDYQKCNLIYSYSDKMPDDVNYISNNELIFQVYKTSKKYGKQIFKLKPELKEILNMYIKQHPLLKGKLKNKDNVTFLVYFNGKPLIAVNSITRILNKIFNKKIGSSQLRKIFVSDKFGKNSELNKLKEEQKETAEKMGHTVATQNLYYVKDDTK
jgi:hypothetical protein